MAAVFQLVSQLSHSLMRQDTASALQYVWNISCVVCSTHTHTHIQMHMHRNRHSYSHLKLTTVHIHMHTHSYKLTSFTYSFYSSPNTHTSMTQIPILHVFLPPVRVASTSCMPLLRMAPSPTTMSSLPAAGQWWMLSLVTGVRDELQVSWYGCWPLRLHKSHL